MKKRFKGLILLLITLMFLFFILFNIDFSQLLLVLKKFEYIYIVPLIISMTISLSFRAICFKQLLYRAIPDVKIFDLIPLCITCAGLNIALPARAGDMFRAYYTGHKYNADKMRIFGCVVLERLFDVVIIFLLLILGVFIYHKNPLAEKLCIFAATLLVFGIFFAVLSYKYNIVDKMFMFLKVRADKNHLYCFIQKILLYISNACNSFIKGFEIINSPKKVIYVLLSSFGIWVFECINYLIVIQGFGYDIHWSVSLFVIGFIALACMIPSTSIFIGPYQVAVIAAFSVYGISKESALAISLIEQSIITLYLVLFAFLFLIRNNISYKEIKNRLIKRS